MPVFLWFWTMTGRVGGIVVLSALAMLTAWATGVVAGVRLHVTGGADVLAIGLALNVVATVATCQLLAALFVVARSARTLQNAITYPFYLLSGVLVPVSMLPGWAHPVSDLIYLKHASDLLRYALGVPTGTTPTSSLRWLAGLALVTGALAWLAVRAAFERARRSGEIGFA